MTAEANIPCRRRAIWANKEKQNEQKDETRPDADAKTDALPEVSKYVCSKCGKEYRRGMYFHFKNCKG